MSTAKKVQKRIEWHQSEIVRLQQFMKQLEEFEGGDSSAAPPVAAPRTAGPKQARPGRFKDMGVVDGAVVLVGESPKRGLDTRQIADGLRAGGFATDAVDFPNSVHALLHRESKKEHARLKREDKLWKLTSV